MCAGWMPPTHLIRSNSVAYLNYSSQKGLCPVILHFTYSSYCRQHLTVKWNDTVSGKIKVQNGVKQGRSLTNYE